MISNACATMRTAKSFLPLLRPFIIRLLRAGSSMYAHKSHSKENAPVYQTLNNRHLRLLELLLGKTACSVGQVDGMADLNVVRKGDVVNVDAIGLSLGEPFVRPVRENESTHSWVSHLPKSLTS